MWRFAPLTILLLFVGIAPAVADEDGDYPVLRIHGDDVETVDDVDEIDEEVLELLGGEEEARGLLDEDEEVEESPEFIIDYVDWEFVPVIEVRHARGAVTEADVQRTVNADREAIADCFEADSYPGDGAVEVDVFLSYNGVPVSVNGNTDQVLRPNQARCVLRRAWRYQFPRIAEVTDQESQLGYRVTFTGQKIDPPEMELGRAQLLLERVRTDDADFDDVVARSLVTHLPDVRECAVDGLQEMSTDMVATRVEAAWEHAGAGRYRPTDVDITVTNKTSDQLPSADVVNCYVQEIRRWEVELDDEIDRLPDNLSGSYYITVRPAGWYGL